uniref:Uncharacterized protein n=1 Tax=Arundo donax TaxID=35708 RepID=A0A0A9GQ18_ARUDO
MVFELLCFSYQWSVRQQHIDICGLGPFIGCKRNVGSHETHRAIYKSQDSCPLNLFSKVWGP